MNNLERDRLRIAFVIYGAMNRKDWRTVSIEDVDFNETELALQLIPTLRTNMADGKKASIDYGKMLVNECRQSLSILLPFTDAEKEFLDLLLDKGKIDPTFLTTDASLQDRIGRHPLLKWKALNVRKHKRSV